MGQRLGDMYFEACTKTSRTAVRKMSKAVSGVEQVLSGLANEVEAT